MIGRPVRRKSLEDDLDNKSVALSAVGNVEKIDTPTVNQNFPDLFHRSHKDTSLIVKRSTMSFGCSVVEAIQNSHIMKISSVGANVRVKNLH